MADTSWPADLSPEAGNDDFDVDYEDYDDGYDPDSYPCGFCGGGGEVHCEMTMFMDDKSCPKCGGTGRIET